jgi:GTPase SAR1 family protein
VNWQISAKDIRSKEMSVLERATTGKQKKPRKVTIYGGQGNGKSTIASKFPKSIFLATEDGTSNIDCTRVQLESAIETLQAANECVSSDFETIVLDSADWFEKSTVGLANYSTNSMRASKQVKLSSSSAIRRSVKRRMSQGILGIRLNLN